MQPLPIEQAEGRLAEIVKTLAPGEELVLTRDGTPVATIRAAEPPRPREAPRFGTLKGTVLYMAPDFDAPLEGFE